MSARSRTSSTRRLAALLAPVVALAACAQRDVDDAAADERNHVSGAYRALSLWGDSRAYPGRDIPPDAFGRAYEYCEANLPRTSLAGAATPPGAIAGTTGWQPIGPTNCGGRTLTVAFDPANPNTIWAGAASGGLWRSTTGGVGTAAWERIDTGLPVLGVSTIAFAPGGVIYIGTGEVYNHQTAGDLEADRRTRGSYGIGVIKSTDGGATWSKSLDWTYEQRHGVWAVRVDPGDPSVVWAATTDGVYKSEDAGGSWTQTLGVVMAMDLVVHPLSTDTVLVGCGDLGSPGRGLYRTTDGGDHWSQVVGGGIPPDFQGKIQLGVTPADPDVVYASIGNGFEVSGPGNATWLLRSADFGASFALRNTTDYSRWQGWYAHDVAVSPTDADTLICVGIDVWRSTDGGATLFRTSDYRNYFTGGVPAGGPEGLSDYSHADHHDVRYHPTNPNVIYFGNDGGVFRSLDGGVTFAGVNGGYQTSQFYNGSTNDPTDPDLAMGGLQDNASAIYHGTGEWDRWVLGGDGGWCAIDPTNPNHVFATAQFRFIGRSTDGGVSFSNISPPDLGGAVAFIAPFVMSQEDPQILYVGSSYLLKTFDSGAQWFIGQGGAELDGNPILLLAVAADNDDVVYAATAPIFGRGHLFRTLGGGGVFDDVTGILPDRYPGDLAIDPSHEGTVYLTLSGFGTSHVFRSLDYGATWVDIDQGRLPDVPTTAIVVDPHSPHFVYVGNDIGVYVTYDGGATWTQLDLGLSEAVLVNELGISASDRKLRAFTHGQGVFEHDLVGPLVDDPAPSGTLRGPVPVAPSHAVTR